MRYAIIALCAVLLAFAGFVAIGAMRLSTTEHLLNSVPNPAELKAMEAQATKACRCARKLKDKDPGRDACWSKFKRNVDQFAHSEMAAACLPLSTSVICFGNGVERCITNDFGGGACTAEEARTLEAVWANSIHDDDPKSFELAEKRMNEAVQSFIRGEKVATSAPSGATCSG